MRQTTTLIIILLISAGCSAAPGLPLATATLPAPEVITTPGLAPTATEELPTPTVTLAADLAELARQTYVDRLIDTLTIPALNLISAVHPVGWQMDPYDPESMAWDSPDAEVGWSVTSALPDSPGNIILYGHNNIHSSIFKYLYELEAGDEIRLKTGQAELTYTVSRVEILAVEGDAANQEAYLQYFKPSRVPRLTLLSCYPPDNNTHRVIVIAYPALTGP